MVFFANSGAGFPTEEISERAGALALEAASEMWLMLSRLEHRNRKWHQKTDDLLHSSASKLHAAAELYEDISYRENGLYPFNFQSAARIALVDSGSELASELYLQGPTKNLYRELSRRLSKVAKRLSRINVTMRNYDMRSEVFEIMREWEQATSLARIIAVGAGGDGPPRPASLF